MSHVEAGVSLRRNRELSKNHSDRNTSEIIEYSIDYAIAGMPLLLVLQEDIITQTVKEKFVLATESTEEFKKSKENNLRGYGLFSFKFSVLFRVFRGKKRIRLQFEFSCKPPVHPREGGDPDERGAIPLHRIN